MYATESVRKCTLQVSRWTAINSQLSCHLNKCSAPAEIIDREFVTSAKKSRILTNFPKLKKFVKIRKKFVKCPSRRAAAGTRVINYPGNFLLPDGTGTRVVNI